MGKGGLEPPPPFGDMILSHARLPLPTLPHMAPCYSIDEPDIPANIVPRSLLKPPQAGTQERHRQDDPGENPAP